MRVLAAIADTSYWPALIWQGTPALLELFSAHSQAVLHTRWLARKHTHTSTHTHLSEEIIIHYPFKEKKIYLYHCNGTFCVKCHFSNVYRQLTGTGFFAAAPGLASTVRRVVLRHLHSSEMQQWQPGGWGEKITKYINKTEGRKRKQKGRGEKKIQKSAGLWYSTFLRWQVGAESYPVSYLSMKKKTGVGGKEKKRESKSHALFRDRWLFSVCFPESVLGKTQLWIQKASRLVYGPPWSIWSIGRAMRPWKQNLISLHKKKTQIY